MICNRSDQQMILPYAPHLPPPYPHEPSCETKRHGEEDGQNVVEPSHRLTPSRRCDERERQGPACVPPFLTRGASVARAKYGQPDQVRRVAAHYFTSTRASADQARTSGWYIACRKVGRAW